MNTRELGFLLIGLGNGLLFAVALVILWFHHMFIIGLSRLTGSIVVAIPFVLMVAGIVLSRRGPRKAES